MRRLLVPYWTVFRLDAKHGVFRVAARGIAIIFSSTDVAAAMLN
jgi:hypothetical protein